MNHKLITALVCLGMTSVVSAQTEVDFDRGVDVSNAVEQAVQIEAPDVRQPGYPGSPWHQWDYNNFHNYPGPHSAHVRFSRDCRKFYFGPSSGALWSEQARLESVEYIRECHWVPGPGPHGPYGYRQVEVTADDTLRGPGGGGHPGGPGGGNHGGGGHGGGGHHPGGGDNHGGNGGGGHHPGGGDNHGGNGGGVHHPGGGGYMECHDIPTDVFRRTVQLTMAPRQLLPWESDNFEVCMEGPRVDMRTISAAYSYSIKENGQYDIVYELSPRYKIATSPDSNGLSAGEFSSSNGKFTFKVNDKWAAEYAGDKTLIKVELFKDGWWFFNSSEGAKEFIFDAAPGYVMTFGEKELDDSKSIGKSIGMQEGLTKGSGKYYIKWGFKRVGKVSAGEFVDKGEVGKR